MSMAESNDAVMRDADPPTPVVPVSVETPVRTHELPSRASGATMHTAVTLGLHVLAPDPRRKVAILLSLDDDIVVAQSQAGLATGAVWLQNLPLIVTHADSLWVAPVNDTETRVSVLAEGWA